MNKEKVTQVSSENFSREKIKSMVITAVFISLTYIFTCFVNICIPPGSKGGLVHLGNIPLLFAAMCFGRKTGALAGSFGMGIFDLLGGWAIWAPFTFVINGCMGYVVGAISEKHQGFKWNVTSIIMATIIKIVGYYVAEVILYGNWIVPFTSIPGNILQVWVAAVVVLASVDNLKKVAKRIFH